MKGIHVVIGLFFSDITIMKKCELGRNPVGAQEVTAHGEERVDYLSGPCTQS